MAEPVMAPNFTDAEMARFTMGVAADICLALGVSVRHDVQAVDSQARNPQALIELTKKMNMILTALIGREGLTAEFIASIRQSDAAPDLGKTFQPQESE